MKSAKITLEKVTLNRSTEKAINVTFFSPELSKEITVWLPKFRATIEGSTLTVTSNMYAQKLAEIRDIQEQKENDKKDVQIFGQWKEFEKSYGLFVQVYECVSEQSIRRSIYVPKSMILAKDDNSITIAQWLWRKKVEELKDNCESGSFSARSMEIEVDTQLVDSNVIA